MSEVVAAAIGGVAGYALGRQAEHSEDAEVLISAADTIEQLQLEVQRLTEALRDSGADGQITQEEADALQARIGDLQARLEELAAAASTAEEALATREAEVRAEMRQVVDTAEARARTAEQTAAQLQARVSQLEEQVRDLSLPGEGQGTAQLAAMTAQLAAANQKLDALRGAATGSVEVTTTVEASIDVVDGGFDQPLPTAEASPFWCDGSLIRATDATHTAATLFTNVVELVSGKERRVASFIKMRQSYDLPDGVARLALSVPGESYPTGLVSLLLRGSVVIEGREYGLGTALSRMRYVDLDMAASHQVVTNMNITNVNLKKLKLWDNRVPSVTWVRAIATDAVQLFMIAHPTKFASAKNKTFAFTFAAVGAGTPLRSMAISAMGVCHEYASTGLIWKGSRAYSYLELNDCSTTTSTKPKRRYISTENKKSPVAPSARTPATRKKNIKRSAQQTVRVPKDWVLEYL